MIRLTPVQRKSSRVPPDRLVLSITTMAVQLELLHIRQHKICAVWVVLGDKLLDGQAMTPGGRMSCWWSKCRQCLALVCLLVSLLWETLVLALSGLA